MIRWAALVVYLLKIKHNPSETNFPPGHSIFAFRTAKYWRISHSGDWESFLIGKAYELNHSHKMFNINGLRLSYFRFSKRKLPCVRNPRVRDLLLYTRYWSVCPNISVCRTMLMPQHLKYTKTENKYPLQKPWFKVSCLEIARTRRTPKIPPFHTL